MQNKDFTILTGSEYNIKVYQNNDNAISVTFVMKNSVTNALIEVTGSYSVGEASISLTGLNTAIAGTYYYQINENISGGGIEKHGSLSCGDGSCAFGVITICEALDGVVS